jgi:osmoprotectant transport system permease protein
MAMTPLACLCVLLTPAVAATPVQVGSKKFTEGVILGEIATQYLEARAVPAQHRRELGGSRVLWAALARGDIDVYPEYTGTLTRELLADTPPSTPEALRARLAERGIGMTASLGFDNSYVLGMRRDQARVLGIRRIADLGAHPALRLGFSSEFLERADGWPRLREFHALSHRDVRGLDHELAYRALAEGALDVIDLYSTDAEIRRFDLVTLADTRGFFPRYDAVLLYRLDLARRAPDAVAILAGLEGRIAAADMIDMNASAAIDGLPEAEIAARFLREHLGIVSNPARAERWQRLARTSADHMQLTALSLGAAILCAVPLGIWAARSARAGRVILGAAGAVQTIPALALLVFLIPVFGIGFTPAVAALFLYSLLPIIRNTCAGLQDIPAAVRESAIALGMPATARLVRVELPLALRGILAGIKTAAVINVGTATLGALVGAGGYGQPILSGIRRDDIGLIMEGAVPAALLALAMQGAFDVLERRAIPRGLRFRPLN